jgi:prepilin-type N-terminal cleavage/methylation domain-containing protein
MIKKSFIEHLIILNGHFRSGLKSNFTGKTRDQAPRLSQNRTASPSHHNQDSNLACICLILNQQRKDSTLGQRGFSLVEVLASIGILVIISYVVASAMRSLNITVNTANRGLEFDAMVSEITMYMAHQDTCVPFMKNLLIAVPAVPAPYEFPAADVIKMAKLEFRDATLAEVGVEKNGIRVDKAQFDKIVRNDLPPIGANQRYLLNFSFSATKTGEVYGAKSKKKNWVMLVEVDSAKKVVKCVDTANSEEGSCLLKGKTYDLKRYPTCQ